MNREMLDFMACWREEDMPFHHIHGAGRDYETMRQGLSGRGLDPKDFDLRQYIYDMPTVMAAADLVLCRAGASTLSELTATGKPAILVPSPNVTANHQFKLLVEEKDCSGQKLYGMVQDLLADGAGRDRMSQAQLSLAVPTAAEDIYQALMKLMGH